MSVPLDIERDPNALAEWIAGRRWFRSKARTLLGGKIVDVVPVDGTPLAFVQLDFAGGGNETYLVPLGERLGDDALETGGFGDVLAAAIERGATFEGSAGTLRARAVSSAGPLPAGRVGSAEQSNSAVIFGDQAILKLYRRAVEGENPEVELLRALAEHTKLACVPRLFGEIEYERDGSRSAVAMLQGFVKSRGDAWAVTLDRLRTFVREAKGDAPAVENASPIDLAVALPPPPLAAIAAVDFERARKLGRRTAELHVALASVEAPAFVPELTRDADRDRMLEDAKASASSMLRTLASRPDLVPPDAQAAVERLLARAPQVALRVSAITSRPFASRCTRIHGDYHLGQVLVTHDDAGSNDDFVIIDFEGEPARTLEERRRKQLPLRDVAGMLRSFDYASATALREVQAKTDATAAWLAAWAAWCSASFVRGWLSGVRGSDAAPATPSEGRALLDFFLLEKAVYEVSYELNNRPTWLAIPVAGLNAILDRELLQSRPPAGREPPA